MGTSIDLEIIKHLQIQREEYKRDTLFINSQNGLFLEFAVSLPIIVSFEDIVCAWSPRL